MPRREAALEKQAPRDPCGSSSQSRFQMRVGRPVPNPSGSQPPPGLPARTRQTKQKLFKSGRGRRRGWRGPLKPIAPFLPFSAQFGVSRQPQCPFAARPGGECVCGVCVWGGTLQGNFKLHHQPLKNNQRRLVQPELPTGGFGFIPGVPGPSGGEQRGRRMVEPRPPPLPPRMHGPPFPRPKSSIILSISQSQTPGRRCHLSGTRGER